jgi:hypothetical protein
MTDDEREEAVRSALADIHAIGLAKHAAHQRSHLPPRPPARLSPTQLAGAYRREGLRNPHQPTRPTLKVVV